MPKPKRTDAPAPDPDTLVRTRAGAYRTADERFEVTGGASGWFLVDSTQLNDFGQPLMHGPFATLAAVRDALPGARKTKPLPRGRRAAPRPKPAPSAAKPEPPPSWIDALPAADARHVRRLIAALGKDGIAAAEAESLVRRDRDGLIPAIAARLIARRLESLVDELPDAARVPARQLVARVAEILTAQGTTVRDPLPRWSLVEIGPEPEPRNRRIVI